MPALSVELLYFAGCPTYQKALTDLLGIVSQPDVNARLCLTKVGSEEEAQTLRFLGSPTVRVNGVDIEPSAPASEAFGLRCRIYRVDGKLLGSPSTAMLTRALREGGS